MTANAPAEKAAPSAPPRDTTPAAIAARLLGIRPVKPPRRTQPEASWPEVRP